jgi:NAD(P)H-dependent FMN reductase
MKKVLAFYGGTRKRGNSKLLLNKFKEGALQNTSQYEEINVNEINLLACTGCLRCNIIKKCALRNDDWNEIAEKILDADVLVFASPVYFHHVTSGLKKLIDRFRSFIHVQITETGLIHTPHVQWKKEIVLILSMGSPDTIEAKPIVELFEYIKEMMGTEIKLHTILGTTLAVEGQVEKNEAELTELYPKLKLPAHLVKVHFNNNKILLDKAFNIGVETTRILQD